MGKKGHQNETLVKWNKDIIIMLLALNENLKAKQAVNKTTMEQLFDFREKIQDELAQTEEEGALTVIDEILDLIYGILESTNEGNRDANLANLINELLLTLKEVTSVENITYETIATLKSICDDILQIYLVATDPGDDL